MNPRIFPFIFSLLLPGLGQLYQRRAVFAFGFFVLFCLTQFIDSIRIYTPIILIFSAIETLRVAKSKERSRRADWIFASLSFLGLLSWSLAYFPKIHPIGYQMEMNARIPKILEKIKACQIQLKREAIQFETCVPLELQKDIWGNTYRFSLLTTGGFELRSAGPDGAFQTPDDFHYHVSRSASAP